MTVGGGQVLSVQREPSLRRFSAGRTRRALELVSLRLTPALAGAAATYSHTHELEAAALALVAMLVAAHLVDRSRLPLALMPAARIVTMFSWPLLGAGIVVLLTPVDERPVTLAAMEAAVAVTWLVMALGAWVADRAQKALPSRIAVVGSPEFAIDLAAELRATRIRSLRVVGWFGDPHDGLSIARHLGTVEDLRAVTIAHQLELLVYAPDSDMSWDSICDGVADDCFDLPLRLIDSNQLYEDTFGHVPVGTIDAGWYRYMLHPRYRGGSAVAKRIFDIVVAGLIGILALPFLAVAGLAIRVARGGPVLYRQRRLGEHGRAFDMLKLRTMRPDAEPDGPRWSVSGDDRVTSVGRVLRRLHVDELPQVWNVLRGDMTLVGPRPERPELAADLERRFEHFARRKLVKPGIAGWAQIRCGYAGSERGASWKLCYDLFYIKHRSLFADVLILIETAFQAVRDAHRILRTPGDRFVLGKAVIAEQPAESSSGSPV